MAPHYEQTRDAANAALLADLSTLLTSEEHTDLKIKLGDRVWNVHKAIVCARSDFFAKACKGDFKYDDADTEVAPVLFNVRMVAAAEKYFVKFLAPLAVSKLDFYLGNVETAWGSEDFADAIAEAYTTTHDSDRELRDTLLKVAVEHAHELFDKKQTDYAHFQEMAAKTPSFSMEVAAMLAKPCELETYRCPYGGCDNRFRSSMEEGSSTSWECEECDHWFGSNSYKWWQDYRIRRDFAVIPVDE
ncbi:Kelch-like protein 10 [Elasticomyces elasticus]|nr:Kelch-like protein 10 [Elasticomyces elasticus]KAK3629745.1 Kelch-like protein 10 [Elasticomyces elasticus]KAK4906491.1 Kelch-like protein 10 [Elasticomyces elasticus]KAK5747289.1 Kelch-like protein 10 [Elasticomyces elasticus]